MHEFPLEKPEIQIATAPIVDTENSVIFIARRNHPCELEPTLLAYRIYSRDCPRCHGFPPMQTDGL
ncbi:hypothetical protein BDN67DRAFT_975611 [Paxillus ammoniavirescens]|nr:hypothetical protein BDN67DRAFT_975611 [Paxillus ammoniavirescens]